MAHRIVRAGAALAATVVLVLPTAASADSAHDHVSPSADPHAGHDNHAEQTSAPVDPHAGHAEHEAGDQDAHSDHGGAGEEASADHDDHGVTTEDDAGHTDHGTQPDSVSPEVRNLVLSGFAGVNAAVIFGAWMVRRTGPDPDPRKRTQKASR